MASKRNYSLPFISIDKMVIHVLTIFLWCTWAWRASIHHFVRIYSYDERRKFGDVHSSVNLAWFIYCCSIPMYFMTLNNHYLGNCLLLVASCALVAVCIYLPFIHQKVNILYHANMNLLNRKRRKNSFFVLWLHLCDWHKCWWSIQIMWNNVAHA